MPLLPFTPDQLILSDKGDMEMVALADRHYSREKIGNRQFMPPGSTMVLRDCFGLVCFAWLHQAYRSDGQNGYNCSIFRNESPRLSSSIIVEAEQMAIKRWGHNRVFTYIDPKSIKSVNPGFCFKQAGWQLVRNSDGTPYTSTRGFLLLEKQI